MPTNGKRRGLLDGPCSALGPRCSSNSRIGSSASADAGAEAACVLATASARNVPKQDARRILARESELLMPAWLTHSEFSMSTYNRPSLL